VARIVIIEDEPDLQEVLGYNLRAAGHEVVPALRAQDGMRLIRERRPDLVLLDLMLPDLPGTEVIKAIRQDAQTRDLPVIMLTAKNEEVDRVVGFEIGADDYVAKPFSTRELLLRIQAILRRGIKPAAASSGKLSFGVLEVDLDAHRVFIAGQEVELTMLEFKLLVTLYQQRNRVQTRARLLSDVWEMKSDISTRTVDTHVKRLREKLGAAGDYIETVRGVGYRFAGREDEPTT
jgi:two-component system, OmpR family, phosphate regulon response regulator PhoB